MVTISDVAKRAGVAISTVSNIINGTKRVSPETTERVMKAIHELNYEADPIARSLKNTSSNMIGVIITNFSRIFFAPVLRRCREVAVQHGYELLCIESNDDFELEKRYVEMMRTHRFKGIILDTVSDVDNEAYFEYLRTLSYKDKPIHVVSVERDLSAYGVDSVEADNFAGAVQATRHLIHLGCREILHITGPAASWAAELRARGYVDTIQSGEGMAEKLILGDFSPKSGYDAIAKITSASLELPFDGIFASNDQMAIGAMKALKENNIGIPAEVKVAGFDDSFVAALVEPSLTSVHVSGSAIGAEALKLLLGRMMNPRTEVQLRRIAPSLAVRRSTDASVYLPKELVSW